jgi:hypothetical protein
LAGAGVTGAGVGGAGEAAAGVGFGVGFCTLIVESGEPLFSFCFLVVLIVSTLALIQPGLSPSQIKQKYREELAAYAASAKS